MAKRFSGSKTGKASTFGGAKGRASRVLAPWGKPIPHPFGRKANASGVTSRGTGKPRGSDVRRATPDASLRGMRYPKNDPLQWPVENPTERSDLNSGSGMTSDKADWNNDIVNHAYQRGGYDG